MLYSTMKSQTVQSDSMSHELFNPLKWSDGILPGQRASVIFSPQNETGQKPIDYHKGSTAVP